jgi:hypothetical protein
MHSVAALTWKQTLLGVISASVMAACASTSAVRPAADGDRAEGSSMDRITMTELFRLDPGLPLMDAIEHMRPWFLHPRGSVAMVSIDHSPPLAPAVLRTMSVSDAREIRLLRATGAGASAAIRADGTVAVGDIILVVTARGHP